MEFNITEISTLIVKLVFGCLSVFVISYLKQKLGQEKFDESLKWVKIAVMAAEQLYDSSKCEEKKQYVLNYLDQRGIKLDASTLDKMIESCVLELHNELHGDSNASK